MCTYQNVELLHFHHIHCLPNISEKFCLDTKSIDTVECDTAILPGCWNPVLSPAECIILGLVKGLIAEGVVVDKS